MLTRPLSSAPELIPQNSKIDGRNNRRIPGRAGECLRKGSPFNSLGERKKKRKKAGAPG